MEGLSQRTEEVKRRWYRYDIPRTVDAVIQYLREGVIRSVSELQKDLSPKLRRLLSRPERQTTRGFLKWYFEKYSPRVLKGLKRVFGRMLQELVKYKVTMEMHLYSFPIQKAQPQKLKYLEERERIYFYVRRLRSEVDKHLYARGRTSRRADSLDNYSRLLNENFKKLKDQVPHQEQHQSDSDLDSDQEYNMQNMMNEIMTAHGLGERVEPQIQDENIFYGSFLRDVGAEEEREAAELEAARIRIPKSIDWFEDMPYND